MRNLFLLSFQYRDPLAARISAGGWHVSSARRKDRLKGRFLSSHALTALVDLREAVDEGLAAIAELANLDENRGIAILALADEGKESDIAAKCYDAGATHFLDISNPHANLEQAINFAYRYVENVLGAGEATDDFNMLLAQIGEQWSFSKSSLSQNWISENLKSAMPEVDFNAYPVTGIYRTMSDNERARVRGAMGRLRTGAKQAAVAYVRGGNKVIQHLHDSGKRIHGRLERVTENEKDLGWAGRDLASGLRNGSAAKNWMRSRFANGHSLGLIMFGIKNFATINAAYGRVIGDEIMRRIGQRLIAKTTDYSIEKCLVARMDGQNFVVAMTLDETDEDGVQSCISQAEKLLNQVFDPISVEARDIGLVARAGVAVSDGPVDETLLIRRATLALAEAMGSDALPLKISSSSDNNILVEQQLEAELLHAIERGDITIALQPQIKVATGQLTGAEALARWNHPKLGFLGAATLFSVAERANLLDLLSSHIHKLALKTAAHWPESLSFLRLSINVTAGDLANVEFVTDMMQKIEKAGFDPMRTTLEITESALIDDITRAAERLAELRAQGLQIAIDDFGTGYSSLSYLKNLPLDYLKIDSGLTGDISGSPKDQVVVKSIIDMAHSLDLSVIAEGVETEAQLTTLAEQGCEYFQGFLRSGPISAEEFEIYALRSD
ncbi:hypothetical protein GCM10009096_24710 [Parasphingorhabdus litoris]|uniref:Bifunctional diguanylate cyclase/phosphodiesterase n=1 Tax=Parasphingorhabdus litoris TaxID=394733 RepID=A0ABN1AQW7_9SPHN|nr:GGDEF domain-containing phosphodiesterase [Parasphingorhabdus litoris]